VAQTGYAFFDVDGTLTTETTLFKFLEFVLRAEGAPPSKFSQHLRRLTTLRQAGASRADTNRAYFEAYADRLEATICALGGAWFALESQTGSFMNSVVVDRLVAHQRDGHTCVLVSGSFPACLDPIAASLGVKDILCSRPQVVAGRYTGHIDRPMIGEAKAQAIRDWLRGHRPAQTWAYGDHESDMPLLEAVSDPVVVGDDDVMTAIAISRGWQRMPLARSASAATQ
jgi:HAD superfamily hydrolase (TIGR01490 family)